MKNSRILTNSGRLFYGYFNFVRLLVEYYHSSSYFWITLKGSMHSIYISPKFPTKLLPVLILLFPCLLHGQNEISGTVFSASDSTRISGAAVYFDGTSIGTVTNDQGQFQIDRSGAGNIPLVISYLGFEPVLVRGISQKVSDIGSIYLAQSEEVLAEVIVEPDPWSRERKMSIFKREFLGKTPAAERTRIKNEEAIRLHYSPTTKKLTAETTEPLIIINKHLGYEIKYDLRHFEVIFKTGNSGLSFPHMVTYEGLSFFQELRKRPRKKYLRNRELAYTGSSLQFMRALAGRELEKNDFRIFHGKFEVQPYQFFRIEQTENEKKITLLAEKLSILYNDLEQSAIQASEPFFIDKLGNHSPPLAILLSGEMSQNRIAELLPLDYQLSSKTR